VGRNRQPSVDRSGPPPVDIAVGRLAARQHGVVSLAQLVALGLSRQAVAKRVSAGRLHRLHRGVYAVGHAKLTVRGRWMAAVLACGPGAVLSHRDAGALHGIRPSSRRKIDVSTASRGRRGPEAIDLHRVRRLDPRDVTAVDGIPVTTVARTLADLAEVTDRRGVERALHEAEVRRVLDMRAVSDASERLNGRHRVAILTDVVRAAEPAALTASELEHRMLELCRSAGLPAPTVNAPVEGLTVDFLWREQRLIVETDGAQTHLTRRAFEEDRARDVLLTLAGYTVLRFTHRQIEQRPDEVARALAQLLSAR
jgi:very-short-patch-repair endonuclease/predicted transcriptional regulator of viral defense system